MNCNHWIFAFDIKLCTVLYCTVNGNCNYKKDIYLDWCKLTCVHYSILLQYSSDPEIVSGAITYKFSSRFTRIFSSFFATFSLDQLQASLH